MQPLALTSGEPAGIGPDLCVLLAQKKRALPLVCLADEELLRVRATQLGLPLTLHTVANIENAETRSPGHLVIAGPSLEHEVVPGQLNPANAGYVLQLLDTAISGCQQGTYSAMVTAPLHKGVINDAGIPFSGHTEYLAEKTGGQPIMMLLTESLRVALATTHMPLKDVATAITQDLLKDVMRVLVTELQQRFALSRPRILVCGLNPHAGESGHLGNEEITTIIPALESLADLDAEIVGPLPADTLFTPRHLDAADAVLAMYHDQGLPVLKYAGFGNAVNLTLGLPIIRTSVDHGTALDLAGTGDIDSGSLDAAIALAAELASKTSFVQGN